MYLQLNTILATLVFFVTLSEADGYFWSLFGAPIADQQPQQHPEDGNQDTMSSHPRNIFTPPSGHMRDDPDSAAFQQLMPKPPCTSDKACGRGRFCDYHYGSCRLHKMDGEPCRRDGHCLKTHDCRFGTCHVQIKPATEGARCKNDKDCGTNMCCAKQQGESICKAKLPVGAKCYVPEGGVEYVIDSICPCDEGLICKATAPTQRQDREEEFAWRYWTDYDHMRCQPPRFPVNERR